MKRKPVSKANPCPVCQHDSWCVVGEDDVLCMRVQSEKPHTLTSGETGWWHQLDGVVHKKFTPKKEKERPKLDVGKLMKGWRSKTKPDQILTLAKSLGVQSWSLLELGVAWAQEYRAWAWPMRDGGGDICGVRLRWDDGNKKSVTGSKSGIFYPWCPSQTTVYLPEGPTDTAALLSINCYAIGRPSCSGGMLEIKQAIQRLGIQCAVIIADNDDDKFSPSGVKFNPGYDGARALARHLPCPCCVLSLPAKDAREFVNLGGTAQVLDSLQKNVVWEFPITD
jgi:hypothetical protein